MTEVWDHYNPVKIRAGRGAMQRLPQLLSGSSWLLITTPGFTRRGLTAQVQRLASSVDFEVCDQITPNPELDELEALAAVYRHKRFEGILAIGGGSVIDAAKVLALTIPSAADNALTTVLRQGQKPNWLTKLPLVAIPTTSGTGAEVTPFATVWDAVDHQKYSLVGEQVYPDIALLDPELILTLPEQETLYTGLDAVSHALESLWNINRSPVSQAYAIQALELAEQALPQALSDPDNLDARESMQQASVLAGLAISQTRTAIAHSISYPLTSHFNVPHGLACSFTLSRIIEYYLHNCGDEISKCLMLRIAAMLSILDLPHHIETYVNHKEIHSLKDEMFHRDRVGNFKGIINNDTLDRLLFNNYA
ncbi:MAG: phosphonoacetaldehyde reductase [Desulfoarculaceae bacterium]|nr:phosphonoacetaldehyde reductase [Desulfoarculaceae bacterium]